MTLPISGSLALPCKKDQRACLGTQKMFSARYSSQSSGSAPFSFNNSWWRSSKASETNLRKIRPSTTCLYSEASMWPRILSAACHSFCSNPRFAPLALDELERFFAISLLIGVVYYRPTEGAFFSQRTREMGTPFSGELRKADPSLRSG